MADLGDDDPQLDLEIDYGRGTVVEGRRLLLARRMQGVTAALMAKRIGVKADVISAWEQGKRQPRQYLAAICLEYRVLPSYLGRGVVPMLSGGPHFRASASPAKYFDQASASLELTGEIANYFDRRVGLDLVELPSIRQGLGPIAAARAARERFGIGRGPVVNAIRVLERAGAVVTYYTDPRRPSVDAYSAMAGRTPVVMLAGMDNYYRCRWTAIHELGHLLMHRNHSPGSPNLEAEANTFAAEFLLPEAEIIDLLPGSLTAKLDLFLRLKEEWGVSVSALINRAHELGRLSDQQHAQAKALHAAKGWSRSEPGAMTRVESANRLAFAYESYLSTGVGKDEVLAEIGLPADFVQAVLARYPKRAVPPQRPTPFNV